MGPIFKRFPSTWDREDWLQWRRQGIGASDVAALCGMSTYASPLAVYLEKIGRLDSEEESEAMRWGRLLEQPILDEFAFRTGLYVAGTQVLLCDPEHPWRRATLDALAVDSDVEWENELPPASLLAGEVEVKTTGDYSWDDDHGGVPDRVALQVQWQLGCARLQRAWLAVLHQGRRLRIYDVEFDPKLFDALAVVVDRFWETNVLGQVEPPADSNPATTAALKAAYAEPDDASVMLDEEGLFWAKEWLPAKEIAKEAAAHVELIENNLRRSLGDAIEGVDEVGPLVSWRPQAKGGSRLDEKALKAAHPDLYEQFKKPPETVRVLRPTKALRALHETVSS